MGGAPMHMTINRIALKIREIEREKANKNCDNTYFIVISTVKNY